MGQKRPVQVYLMVTTGTIEENMLKTLAAKKDLSIAALDIESDVTKVDLTTGIDNLKQRLEQLIGAKPEAPIDESEQQRVEEEARRLGRRRTIEESGGKLFAALFSFAQTLLPETAAPAPEAIERFSAGLKQCLETDTDGSTKLTIRLPSEAAFKELAGTLASFAALTQRK